VTVYDDKWPDQAEEDPRWEVQPILGQEDESSGNNYTLFVALATATVLAATLVWLMPDAPLGS
jgi:hypothetical protein